MLDEPVLAEPATVAPAPAPAPFRPTNAGPVDNIGQAPGNEISDMDAAKGNTISEMDAPRSSISEMDAPRNSIKEIDTAPSDGRDPIAREPAAR
ncbi:MAG: hypothetical protein H7138_16310 [Myxococcales bacterium]|nr:hypothetical protein [Myxococcales bacterium]